MSLFSKEYILSNNISDSFYDFSYLDEFQTLKTGECYLETCEGLGVHGIINKSGKPKLITKYKLEELELVDYYDFLRQQK